ncbi:S-adenosylmethionine-dependent methyltransferase-like protein [Colletotrichum tofieldiae]|nr:S-adenosylmethionine-dependent methyltransferase-like protein [Colletotrichum tofieldiae]
MPAFGRIGRHHNRSQQALVDPGGEVAGPAASHSTPAPPSGSAAAGPGAPSSSHSYPHSSLAPASGPPGPAPTPASNAITANAAGANNQITPHSASSTAFSSSESFDIHPNQLAHQHQHQQPQLQHLQQPQQGQQGPPPPPHEYPPTSTTAAAAAASRNSLLLQHHNPPIADLRQRSQQDFTDSVSRSQSQRYPPGVAPYPNNNQFNAAASSSVDNLRASVNNTSPAPVHSQATSPLPQPAPEKRSARRLLKNILGGSGRDHHNTPPPQPTRQVPTITLLVLLAGRPRETVVSQQSSQQSLDQQSADWPLPGPHQQPSPLQGVGEIEDRRLAQDPNRDPRLQNPEPNRNSVRYVPTDFDNTPYEEPVYGDQHPQQVPALQEQHQLGQQAVHDPSQQQYQQYSQQQSGQYQAGPPAIYTSHLGAGSHQNPETVSQLSHESPVTDSDARSANVQSTQTSPQ